MIWLSVFFFCLFGFFGVFLVVGGGIFGIFFCIIRFENVCLWVRATEKKTINQKNRIKLKTC